MTPTELDHALCAIDWSNGRVAGQLGCTESLVRKWLAGRTPIPPPVGRWLAELAAAHTAHPPPAGWRVEQRLAAFDRATFG
jgi:hypothetical protein